MEYNESKKLIIIRWRNALLKFVYSKKVRLLRNDNRRRKAERTGKYGSGKQRKNLGRRCSDSNL